MQVGVHQPGVGALVPDQVGCQAQRLLDEPSREAGRRARQGAHQPGDLAAERGQLRRGRAVQLPQQLTDHRAGLVHRQGVQVPGGVEPFQQHRPAGRVGREQPHRAAAAPQLEGEVLVPGLASAATRP